MQWPPTRPGLNGRKFHLVPAASSTLMVSIFSIENDGEFVDQGDVEVALDVFDHLGGLGDLDAPGVAPGI